MAQHQSARKSDLEKRLKILRSQVYGKQSYFVEPTKIESGAQVSSTAVSDLKYLSRDLWKILALSGLALGTEAVLFFLLQNQILKFYW